MSICEVVVTSLVRHFSSRLSAEGARAAADVFMQTAASRAGRPVAWDERPDAPRVSLPLAETARTMLLEAAVRLDDPQVGAGAPPAAGAGEAVEAVRLRLRRTRFPHLVRSGEIFLPVGFDRPIDLLRSPIGGTVLGSSFRLLAELEQVRDETDVARRTAAPLEEALDAFLRLARESVTRRLPLLIASRA